MTARRERGTRDPQQMRRRANRTRERGRDRGNVNWTRWLILGVPAIVVIAGVLVWLARQQVSSSGALIDQSAPATALALPSTGGSPVTLRSLAGKKIVLYFYEGST